MPIVGEAVVIVRVLSNNLARDIRKAVKDALDDANADIDKAGESAGTRLGEGVTRGTRKSRAKIGKELELAIRNGANDANDAAGAEGDRVGQNFGTRFARASREKVAASFGRELEQGLRQITAGNSTDVDTIGHNFGDRFGRQAGISARESLGRELGQGLRQLPAGNDVGRNFMRQIESGIIDAEPDFENTFRRVSGNATKNTEKDWGDDFRRIFVSSIRGSTPEVSEEYGRLLRNSFRTSVRNAARDTKDDFVDAAKRSGNFFRTELGQHRLAFRGIGQEWARFTRAGFGDGPGMGNLGDKAADDIERGLRRGTNRNRTRLGALFSGIGNDMFKHFNLGFGAARMGAAIISVLATAAPSIISGLAAIITAVIADLVNLAAALGPGIAGGIGVGIAAVSTLALNFGLLTLAMSKAFKTVEGAKVKDSLKEIGNLLGTPVAQGLLEGMLDSVNRLKVALPQLDEILKRTGQAYGQIIERILDTVSTSENMTRIGKILDTNIGFLNNFKDGIGGLVESFIILFAASKPFIDYIGIGVKHFGEWAAASLKVSEANGNLATWMDGMLASFKDLLGIIKNFGSGIGNIFSAAATPGASLLDSIRGIAQRFHDWTSDTSNMATMTAFFTNARELASKVYDVLGSIFTAGGKAFTNMDLGPIMHVLDTLQNTVGPAIARFFNQIQAGASGNLVQAFDNIGTAMTKMADSGNFEKVAGLISGIIEKITEFAATDFGSNVLSFLVPLALMGGILTSLITPLATVGKGLFVMADAAGLISAPILAVAAAIAAAVGAFILIYQKSESFRQSLSDLADMVGGAFAQAWSVVGPKLEEVWDKVQKLASAIGDRLAPVIAFIAPIIADAIRFIGELFANILDAIGGFIDIITGILTGNWQLIWQGVVEVLGAAWDQIKTIFAIGLAAISAVWDAITAIIYNAGQVIVGIATSVWTGVWSVIQTVASAIWEFLQAGWTALVDFLGTLLNGWLTAVSSIFGFMWNVVTTIASAIWDFLQAGWSALVDFLGTLLNGWLTAVSSIFGFMWDVITTIASAIWDFLQAGWAFMVQLIATLLQGFLVAVAAIWGSLRDTAVSAWNGISSLASTIWHGIVSAITTIANGLISALQAIWDSITSAISTAWNGLVSIVSAVWSSIASAITGPIQTAYETVSRIVGSIIGAVQNALDFISKLGGAQAAADAAANPAAGAGSTFGGVSILGPEGIGGGMQRVLMRHLFDIPGLATGGIVPAIPGGQLFRLGEGGSSERVEPLDSTGLSARDRAMIKSIVGATVSMMSGGGVDVNVQIGETGLDSFVTKTIRRENSDLARRQAMVKR